jgi:Tfp pilus assembly pilus retraction ATPase PilT
MRRERPSGGAEFGNALRSALDQGGDVLAVDPVSEPDELRTLLEVAATTRLVIATVQALSFGETLAKLQQMTQESIGDRVSRLLADYLRAIVFLPVRRPQETAVADTLLIGRDEQALLRKRDFPALRVQQAVRI